MHSGSEQTFFQRHTNGQQIYEKVPNITNHQGNANQNHKEIPLHTYQNGKILSLMILKLARKDVSQCC